MLTAYDKFIQQALKYGFSLFGTAKTEQVTSYRTGDDGDLKKGYPRSGARFVDNGDGTITDRASGLMWVADPGALAPPFGSGGNPVQRNWSTMIDACLALTHAGHSDWRLPNIKELISIGDFEAAFPQINETYFPNTQQDYYWSSTALSSFNQVKFCWNFTEGGSTTLHETDLHYARPVRLGYPKD